MAYPCQLICNDTHRINRPLLMPVTISMPEPSIGPGIRSSGSLNHSSNLRLSTSQRKSERNNKNKSTKRRPAPLVDRTVLRSADDGCLPYSIHKGRSDLRRLVFWCQPIFGMAGFLSAFVSRCNCFYLGLPCGSASGRIVHLFTPVPVQAVDALRRR